MRFVITFLDHFIFFLTVKVCKIWCNHVYMSILQCDIFWRKLIDRNFFNPIFKTKVVLRAFPFFAVSTVLHVIISKQDIQICQIFHIYSTTTLSSVLKPKYSLSIRNKCAYLLESSETSITIWRQEYPQNCYIQDVLWKKRHGGIFLNFGR